MLIADALLTWRLYVVWLRDWRVLVFPGLCLLALSGTALGLVVLNIMRIVQGKEVDSQERTYNTLAMVSVYVTLPLNAISTLMIIGRIWWAYRQLKKTPSHPRAHDYTRIIWALVESGALYTITTLAYLIIVPSSKVR